MSFPPTIFKWAVTFLCVSVFCLSLSIVTLARSPEKANTEESPVAIQYINGTLKIGWNVVAAGNIHDFISLNLFGGNLRALYFLLLWPKSPLTIEICRVCGLMNGKATPGKIMAESQTIKPGEAYIFGHHLPEGIPNLLVCARTDAKKIPLAVGS